MSVRSIVGGDLTLDNLNVTTINDVAYPPVSGAGTLLDVLIAGNTAGAKDINMNNNDILGVSNIALTNINGSLYNPVAGVTSVPVDEFGSVSINASTSVGENYFSPSGLSLSAGTYLLSTVWKLINTTGNTVNIDSITIQVSSTLDIGGTVLAQQTFSFYTQQNGTTNVFVFSPIFVLTAANTVYLKLVWTNATGLVFGLMTSPADTKLVKLF